MGGGVMSRLVQTLTRLIHPPKFVELATSGLTVTIRRERSGSSREIVVQIRPRIFCVDSLPRYVRSRHFGTAIAARDGGDPGDLSGGKAGH